MEAMHFGLPIVASQVKGHTDLIQHTQTGLLYPYGNAEACAQQIRTLLEQPEFAQYLGRQAAIASRSLALSEVLPVVMAAYQPYLPAEENHPLAPV